MLAWQMYRETSLAEECAVYTQTNLFEANIIGVLSEALSAHIQSVLSDNTMLIGAHTTKT